MQVIHLPLGPAVVYWLGRRAGDWCVAVNSDQPQWMQNRAPAAAELQVRIREQRQCRRAS